MNTANSKMAIPIFYNTCQLIASNISTQRTSSCALFSAPAATYELSANTTIRYPNGNKYIGDSITSQDGAHIPHGAGTIEYNIDSFRVKLIATFHNGTPLGDVIIEYRNGDRYVGPVIILPNGDINPHGIGIREYNINSVYAKLTAVYHDGELEIDRVAIEYRSGDIYIGPITRRGLPHGTGTAIYFKSKNKYVGTFHLGVRVDGVIIHPDGTKVNFPFE